MRSQIQTQLLPSIEMTAGSDRSTARPLALPVANVLPERARALNGRLVHLLVLPDVVDGAVASNSANLLSLSGTSAIAGVFLDVVFDQRIGRPAVDRDKNSSSAGGSGTREVDFSCSMSARNTWNRLRSTYLVVPVRHPFPTTKSPAPENWTE